MSHRFDAPWISGAHLYGNAGLGVIGSLIPATGDNGAGYAYNDLSLPADSSKEICGRITAWPSNGTLFAYEDTSFEYSALSDGTDSFQYQLYVDGVATGAPATVNLYVGSVPVDIAGSLGTAAASGYSAGINAATSIAATIGAASATGFAAGVNGHITLQASIGSAVASGHQAAISTGSSITINCAPGTAIASGHSASISSASSTGINCSVGNAIASGLTAAIYAADFVNCSMGAAVASGFQASVSNQNYIRAPAGKGPIPLSAEGNRPRQSSQYRPGNTGGRRL